jgi:kinetochore protein Spc24
VEGSATERGRRELEDETVLRLKVYRSLGIDLEGDGNGGFSKAVIRRGGGRSGRGDVHLVNLQENFTRFFYANYFWGTM